MLPWRPDFSPKIELGQLLQIVAVIGTIGGFVIPAYVGQVRAVDQVRTDQAKTDAQVTALVSALAAAEAAASLRLTADEHRMDLADQKTEEFEDDQRNAIAKVVDAIGDLKVSIAAMRRR